MERRECSRLLWVEDHAAAIDLILQEGTTGETYNIGGFNEWKNIDLIKLLCTIMDKNWSPGRNFCRSHHFCRDRAGHDLRYAIDASHLNTSLGWKPSLQFEEGLEKTVDWYLANEEWLDHVTSGTYKQYYQQQYADR